jgi:serine/threonine-protein kinase
MSRSPESRGTTLLGRLRERGVLRVAASYAVIAWLALQIASVVIEPLSLPKWVMTALIIAATAGFPLAIALAWFLELGEHGIEIDTAAEGAPRPATRGLRHYADAVVIGVLLVAVVVLLVRQSDIGKPKPPENPAIAVLPFENRSGDPAQEYFSDGLAEEMLDRLGRVPGLRVIARSSSFSFKGKDVDSKTIAERLGVTTILEGSVRRDGQRLKLNARLIDGTTGQQAWSGSFDREVNDIFAVQAELASAIVSAIIPAARGTVSEDPAPPTTDLGAYDLYLLAHTQLAVRTPTSIRKSAELMEQAVRLDPSFARAQAHLGNTLLFLRLMSEDATPEQSSAWLREAEASIHRALALDPDLSEAHGAYANLLRDTERPGAEAEYKRALELNPNNAASWHDYAVYLSQLDGRQRESSSATMRALELDPRQPVTWANYLGWIVEPGSRKFREEYRRALHTVGDMPVALDRITLPWAATHGYPVLVMEAGLAKQAMQSDQNLPSWINFVRAWSMVDLDRAAQRLEGQGGVRHGVDYGKIRMFLDAELTGLRGDWAELDRKFEALRLRLGEGNPHVRSQMAFWLAVQGRHGEAATSLAMAEPTPDESGIPPLLSGTREWGFGLMDTAKVRILRATGRGPEATRIANERLAALRAERRDVGSSCKWDGWLPNASLAANEGLREEAMAALQDAMRCGELPYAFQPQLPWFRGLEGHPPYEALLRERERRIEKARAELIRLEDEAATGTGSQALLQSPATS